MIHIGIDPGLTGAVSMVRSEGLTWVYDTPTLNNGGKNTYDIVGMYDRLDEILKVAEEEVAATFEQVQVRPNQHPTSGLKVGWGIGLWEGLLVAHSIPYVSVSAAKWKRYFGLIGGTKEDSRQLAIQKYPHLRGHLNLKKHHGRAEAILIGLYGLEQHREE